MTPEEKRQRERAEERRKINTYAPLEALEKIARDHVPGLMGRQNGLDTMDSDELDFCEISVWGLKEALIEAYRLGQKDADADLQKRLYKLGWEAKGFTPPLMAGDKVYQTNRTPYGGETHELTITKIIYDTNSIAFDESAIGESIFLTQEAAEKSLKEDKV